jgi:hypothetical protein
MAFIRDVKIHLYYMSLYMYIISLNLVFADKVRKYVVRINVSYLPLKCKPFVQATPHDRNDLNKGPKR